MARRFGLDLEGLRGEDDDADDAPRERWGAHRWILLGIVVVGLLVRLTGWSNSGLYFDDAWFALPARVPMDTAVHMIVTAPGFTLLERGWIRLFPSITRWALALPLLLGVMAPLAVYGFGKLLRFRIWICLVLAGVIAAAPAAIDYSTRVKEYEADLLLGIGLLAFAEVVRRHRSNEALAGFVGLTLAAMTISTSVFPVVVGSWTALVLITLIDHRRRIAVLGSAFVAVGVSSIAALAISARLPPELTRFWSSAHRLLGLPLHAARLTRSLEMTAGGLAHGLVGTPLPVRYPANDLSPISSEVLLGLAVIEFVLFIALAWPSVMAVIRRRAESPALIALASVGTLGVAGFLYGIGKVPLGTGRTDLVLYPAIVVLIGCFLQRVDDRWRRHTGEPTKRTSRVLVGLAVFVALMGTGLAWHERSWYPNQAVEALNAQLHQHLERNDALVITKRNSFSWAYAGLSKWQVHFSRTASAASTIGYWVTFTSPRVLSQHAIDRSGFPYIIGLDHLPSSTHRLWLIGTTASTFSPSAFHFSGPLGQQEIDTGADAILRTNGWSPTLEVLRSDGVFAHLYVRGH